jgi:membrane protease YdiL (CAAX protease family)
VVFGFAHFLPGEGWANLPMVAGLGLLGIALGYLRWASGRLGTAMIAHAVFNMSQLTLLYLTVANSH